ncbi:hypothetical protein ACFQBQ_08935 [Granulicella cerasi]|uniref:Uncharacterized protein n=1 Tax=Granulicella cerasi TaxID=741063 RepID=A0ABW1Z9A5_9BACT|nr:hypothetical protein [Granulicella cerasi]
MRPSSRSYDACAFRHRLGFYQLRRFVDEHYGASHIIGIALDGFPIYGGRDVNGNIVDVTLDACNGITSATPEFPGGAYHYVLPLDASGNPVKTKQSSMNCYTGTVSATLSAQMKRFGCTMPLQLASGKMRLPDGREVTRAEARIWMKQRMPSMMDGIQMASGPVDRRSITTSHRGREGMNMPGM